MTHFLTKIMQFKTDLTNNKRHGNIDTLRMDKQEREKQCQSKNLLTE